MIITAVQVCSLTPIDVCTNDVFRRRLIGMDDTRRSDRSFILGKYPSSLIRFLWNSALGILLKANIYLTRWLPGRPHLPPKKAVHGEEPPLLPISHRPIPSTCTIVQPFG
jgi:hypothetical protein